MSYLLGMISTYDKIESVLSAVGITTFVYLEVTLFSFQTKYDFTSCFRVLFVIILVVLAFIFICIFTFSKIMFTIYAELGAMAFSIFLAVDTQLIMGGKQDELSAEDYIFASLMLYLDIAQIFMLILSFDCCCGGGGGSDGWHQNSPGRQQMSHFDGRDHVVTHGHVACVC
ncbi:unnamed protein product [Rotaria sp. Silwood1]|nr:unnamed protein product [Rotaria sp. Silwood1]CAF4600072.1 unnamed protein product [Rotaria sp. Silwood1]